jgi:DNA-binding response OmpR family regulator
MLDKILCLEDDSTIQTLVQESLRDYDVICVKTIKEAEQLISENTFSALLFDIQLPDGDGLRFATQLLQNDKFKMIPLLILSDHTDISNKVMAFTFGVEDFIGKPFDPIELRARITSKIRRRQSEAENSKTKKLGDLLIDFDRQKAFHIQNGKENDLNLTSIELKILNLLVRRLEQVYSREQIMNQVWGQTFIADRTVDSHIAHVRQKISSTMVSIETAKNFGYRAVLA